MGKITVFNHVTVDGYYASADGGIDWFKSIAPDDEFNAYTHSSASAKSTLIYGRTTYEMMHAFWPTDEAIKMDPQMAKAVNGSQKLVFSTTLRSVEEEPHWKNIQLRSEIDADELRRLKASTDMTILGSGSIAAAREAWPDRRLHADPGARRARRRQIDVRRRVGD